MKWAQKLAKSKSDRSRERHSDKKKSKKGKSEKKSKKEKRKRRRSSSRSGRSSSRAKSERSGSEPVFRIPSTVKEQVDLMRHSRKNPGKLAARLLQDMESGIALGGNERSARSKAPPVAKAYYHQVLDRERGGSVRNKREQITLCTILDHLASGRPQEAADVAAQRIKSVQMATKHGNWDRSCFLELVPLTDGDLTDPSEKKLANREHKSTQQLQPTNDNSGNDLKTSDWPKPWGKPKGGKKGEKGNPNYTFIKPWPKKKGKGGRGNKKGKGNGNEEQKYDENGNPC